MPTVLVKEFFRNFSGIFPEKFRASYFSGKVTTLVLGLEHKVLVNNRRHAVDCRSASVVNLDLG